MTRRHGCRWWPIRGRRRCGHGSERIAPTCRTGTSSKISRRTEIYADCAEPKSIADIKDAGFNVIACDKGAPVNSDKLRFQLQWMQGWVLHVTKDSVDMIRELRNYVWAKDKDGNTLNQPVDAFNHCLDAMRYAVWTRFGRNAGYGKYNISFTTSRHGHY